MENKNKLNINGIVMALTLFLILGAIMTIMSIGYYFGVRDTEKCEFSVDENTKVFCPSTMEEYDIMANHIESNSTGTTIEISMGTVMDSEGNGVSDYGYYIHYDTEVFKEGDRVLSVFTYRNGCIDAEDRYNILILVK